MTETVEVPRELLRELAEAHHRFAHSSASGNIPAGPLRRCEASVCENVVEILYAEPVPAGGLPERKPE